MKAIPLSIINMVEMPNNEKYPVLKKGATPEQKKIYDEFIQELEKDNSDLDNPSWFD